MNEQTHLAEPAERSRASGNRRKRRRNVVLSSVGLVLMVAVGALAFLAISGTSVAAPDWVRDRVEARLNTSLQGAGRIAVGGVGVAFRDMAPQVQLRDVTVYDQRDVQAARLNEMGARLMAPALLRGKVEMTALQLSGAQVTVRRLADGTFDLRFGGGVGAQGTLASVLDGIDQAFTRAPLAQLESLTGIDMTISLEDARSGRIWQVTGGRIDLVHRERAMEIRVTADVFNGTDSLASTVLSFDTVIGSPQATLTATFENAAAADIAAQSPALAFLEVLDAPISGALTGQIDAGGRLGALFGSLEIGAGALQPTPEVLPIRIDSARTEFSYDVSTQRLDFHAVSMETAAAKATASGHAFLQDFQNGWPATMVTQLQLRDVVVQPEGIFAEPMTFAQGAADYRLRLDPFTIEVGQVSLVDQGRRTLADGLVSADATGWNVSLDLTFDAVPLDRILAVWPVPVAGKVRDWISRNVTTGEIANLVGAFRLNPRQPKGLLSVSFTFEDTDLKPMKALPPITGAAGYASLTGRTFSAVLERGSVKAPEGGDIDVAGSVFRVPDVTARPGRAEISVKADSTITAALALLNLKPFEVLKNATLPVSMAEGRAVLSAEIDLPMQEKIAFEDVDYSVTGALERVRSEVLVPGRVLQSGYLELRAGNFGIAITGRSTLGVAAGNMVWSQEFGPDAAGSRVEGVVEIDQAFLDEFNIRLPPGSVTGRGQGMITIDLARGTAPQFAVVSDLTGLGLRLGALNWSKGAGQTGQLEVRGALGATPSIDSVSFAAPGLSATGTIDLNEAGGLAQARFSRVRVGNWLDGAVTLIGRGAAPPSILVSSGQADLRAANFGGGGGGGAQSGRGGGPLTLQLDRLIVSEGIVFTGFAGQFTTQAGLEGRFAARINGATPVTGTVISTPSGAAVRLVSDDAGGALASAGILRNARGGTLDLTLNPTGGPGRYDGRLIINRTRVIRTPALTDLLSAISIVGLVEQLNTGGITMSEVEAEFQLSPSRVTLLRSSAVGPSLGVSLDGIYDLSANRVDMQGVISPVYFLNSIGQVFSRRGEGVFGFNFRLRGTADSPSVSVNPLSILTPGMFREIFRRPPPQPGQ
ncbi:MAG: AsmA family protein [Pseudomonadota bacterium]